ncbi:glycosyl hydrolase family 9 protein [Medicago truncatula]|uniref:cellulase n=1 Tax=Medicago truncatula TaxID=3880 RepID=G7J8S8_MEDTR|nr:glycosyl hydrolase family 9 protein [Medicago truncatula]
MREDRFAMVYPKDYPRQPTTISEGPHLAGEIGVRYIIFEHDIAYSKKLIKGDEALFALARNFAKRKLYNHGQPCIEPYYNSTDYFDEYMWGRCLIVFSFNEIPYLKFLSWNIKLPAAMLLLTKMMRFHKFGYPNEEMLSMYHISIGLTTGSYLHQFNYMPTRRLSGGLMQFNHRQPKSLQYFVNVAFLAYLFLHYIVGYGNRNKIPRHVHHRGVFPNNNPNKHGAVVGEPNNFDQFLIQVNCLKQFCKHIQSKHFEFSHDQLYVAVSKVTLRKGLKILITDENGDCIDNTTNVVYNEVFQKV